MRAYLLIFLFISSILSFNVFAGVFDGEWKGLAGGGISRLVIQGHKVHVYGGCGTKECDWGDAISVHFLNDNNTLVAEFPKLGDIKDKDGAEYSVLLLNVTHDSNKLRANTTSYWTNKDFPDRDPKSGVLVFVEDVVKNSP